MPPRLPSRKKTSELESITRRHYVGPLDAYTRSDFRSSSSMLTEHDRQASLARFIRLVL